MQRIPRGLEWSFEGVIFFSPGLNTNCRTMDLLTGPKKPTRGIDLHSRCIAARTSRILTFQPLCDAFRAH